MSAPAAHPGHRGDDSVRARFGGASVGRSGRRRTWPRAAVAITVLAASLLSSCTATPTTPAVTTDGNTSTAVPSTVLYPSDGTQPDLVGLLGGFRALWTPDGAGDLGGSVVDAATLARNDELAVWINGHATPAEQFGALQASQYDDGTGSTYDASITAAPALGSVLAPFYIQGRGDGSLPLTSAVVDSRAGTSGAYVTRVGDAKDAYDYPRPFLPTAPSMAAPCVGLADASALTALRVGRSYADAAGDLRIVTVPDVIDTTHEFDPADVSLSAGYTSLCLSGSFPSGHSVTAYEAGVTLATLLPELGPEFMARASAEANDRVVLGVHYPLDVMGGRIGGEAGLAARWSDAAYVRDVLMPARTELLQYLEQRCGDELLVCAARSQPYTSTPYADAAIPGGTTQTVVDRESAVAVFRERLTYGFAPTGPTDLAPAVPAGAENLLLTTFPGLDAAQRTSVLAQTQIASGFPLDLTATGQGSWQRLDLAAAMSATVRVDPDGTVTVLGTGGTAAVVPGP